MLEAQQAAGWHDIVTLNESWFYFSRDHECIWFEPEELVPDKERQIISSSTLIITVVWNSSGFYVMTALPKGLKVDIGYYTREILQEIEKWREQQGVGSGRKLSFHMDDARSHSTKLSMYFLEANDMKKSAYPP
jgi:hypothetical protein